MNLIRNQQVGGSNPPIGSRNIGGLGLFYYKNKAKKDSKKGAWTKSKGRNKLTPAFFTGYSRTLFGHIIGEFLHCAAERLNLCMGVYVLGGPYVGMAQHILHIA